MNSPIDGAEALKSGSDPKPGRRRTRRPRKRKGRGKNAEGTFVPEHAAENSGQKVQPNTGGLEVNRADSAKKPRPKSGHDTGQPNPALYAALDLGTNNCRLLIAAPQMRGRFRVVDGFSKIVRLGEGLTQTGRLSDVAMDRAIEALMVCASKLGGRQIRRQRLISTEACRQAENGAEFLDRVKRETGLELEIVDRETEAHLAAAGCGALMDRESEGAVLFDIGGGSSELILVDRRDRSNRKIKDQIIGWTSLPMGVVTLAERFGGKDISRELFDRMVDSVSEEIGRFERRHDLDQVFQAGNAHLLGTSGTVTTLAGIHLRLPRYDRRRVDGLWLTSDEIDAIIDELLEMEYEQRAGNPCVGKERADLVLAGCAILNAIRRMWPCDRLRVADRGLREGLLTEMMFRDGVWSKRRKQRWSKKRRAKRAASGGDQG